jgi:hypothetical protein
MLFTSYFNIIIKHKATNVTKNWNQEFLFFNSNRALSLPLLYCKGKKKGYKNKVLGMVFYPYCDTIAKKKIYFFTASPIFLLYII